MKHRILYGTAAAFVAFVAAASVFSLPSAQEAGVNTASAVEAAGWADTVTLTVDSGANTFRFQSNGIPSHGFAEQYLIPSDPTDQPFSGQPAEFFDVVNSADYFTETEVDTTITTLPVYVDVVTETSLGRIGVAISGAQIFNDYEDMGRAVVAQDDQVIHDHAAFLDTCNGHTLANGSDDHYHGIPVCITAPLEQPDQHSVMIGVLEDGFPVYGNQGVAGAIMTNADLDECSGHFGITQDFPDGIYHYHLTADEAPYVVDSYHGEIEQAARGGPFDGGPDFGAAATQPGVSEAALVEALGTSMPPDFTAAAQTLGISEDDLRTALPATGQ